MNVQLTEKQIRIAAKVAERNAKVIELVQAANGVVRDSHGVGRTLTVTHLIEFVTGNNQKFICPGLDGNIFCLNPILLDEEGKPYVDRCSVGGNIDARTMPMVDAISQYEGSGFINSVTVLTTKEGK